MLCSACRCIVDGKEVHLCCIDCGQLYHLLCIGEKNPNKKTWVCPECRCASKKGGDNSLTPVGASKKHRDPNVTIRKRNSPMNDEVDTSVNQMTQKSDEGGVLSLEIRSLKLEMAGLRDQLAKAMCLIASYESKLECYAHKVDTLNSKLETVSSLKCALLPPQEPQSSSLNMASQEKTKQKKIIKCVSPKSVSVVSETVVAATPTVLHQDKVVASGDADKSEIQPWTEVKSRNNRRQASLCCTAGPAITTLKAVEARKLLHLWNMESNGDEIRQYLRQLCPAATCTVEELTPKGNYKSYKIEVPAGYFEKIYSMDVWPVNARIKPWVHYRKHAGTRVPKEDAVRTIPTSKPFRGQSGSQR